MFEQFDGWKFLAGLGIFLFGMYLLETAIKQLAGRTFKRFMRRHTNNTFKAILNGTLITALLQSSSVVSLMTLAFVGAGILSLRNALGIIFGSNLGTTLKGWIVAALGFKLNFETLSLPMIAIGALVMVLLASWERLAAWGKALTGFGFLFLGLGYMKVSIEYLAESVDLTQYTEYGPWVFLLIGFILTAIIQSSSATMVITLSALNAAIIPFESAAAMVIGADLGTTITALIGGMPGAAAKKQVAMGHFTFNLVVDLIAFLLLHPLIFVVQDIFGVKDEIMGLVVFHSTFNVLGILLFVPFLNLFTRLLERLFTSASDAEAKFINTLSINVPEAALEGLEKESARMLRKTLILHQKAFDIEQELFSRENAFIKHYTFLKHLEGEMFSFYTELQKQELGPVESLRLHQLIQVIVNSLHSAKSIKDIQPNLKEFHDSAKQEMNDLFGFFKQADDAFNTGFEQCLNGKDTDLEGLMTIYRDVEKHYNEGLHFLYDSRFRKKLVEVELSTALTINRELHSARKALVYAAAHYFLSHEESHSFDRMRVG